jgi:hypothetical protein
MVIPLIADSNMKPLCFGSPSVFSLEAVACKECAWFQTCHDASYVKLKAMGEKFDVSDMLARFERSTSRAATSPFKLVDAPTNPLPMAALETTLTTIERTTKLAKVKQDLTETDQAVIAGMPKKVAIKMRRLMELNVDKKAREGLATKVNPFPFKGNAYLHVAFDMLVKNGFTRSSLRGVFQERLKWTEGTAFPHVTAVIWLFLAMQIAVEERGVFLPNPKLTGHT